MSSTSPLTSDQLATLCAQAAIDKKAVDLTILDLRGVSTFTDFFVICSGNSEPHLKAIAGEVQDKLRLEHQMHPLRVDGIPYSQWVIVDFGDVLVHIFHEEKRALYALEDLWGDVPRLAVPSEA
ncbi:MAG: ribosome silencing factor [Verrucomicrobiota bacterium]